MIHPLTNGERDLLVGPVYGGGGREDEVPDPMVPAPLQDVGKPDEIRIDVRLGMRQRMTHTEVYTSGCVSE